MDEKLIHYSIFWQSSSSQTRMLVPICNPRLDVARLARPILDSDYSHTGHNCPDCDAKLVVYALVTGVTQPAFAVPELHENSTR